MDAMKIEILHPKALQLIQDLQALNLIKIITSPTTKQIVKNNIAERVEENELDLWRNFSESNFLKGYSDNEPDYSVADIIEPNPDYKPWKEK